MATEEEMRRIKQLGEDLKHYVHDELEANAAYLELSRRAAELKIHTVASRLKMMAKDEMRHHSSLVDMISRIERL